MVGPYWCLCGALVIATTWFSHQPTDTLFEQYAHHDSRSASGGYLFIRLVFLLFAILCGQGQLQVGYETHFLYDPSTSVICLDLVWVKP